MSLMWLGNKILSIDTCLYLYSQILFNQNHSSDSPNRLRIGVGVAYCGPDILPPVPVAALGNTLHH